MRGSVEVADIFRVAGPAYRAAHSGHLSLAQLKVMSAVENCRTAALGGCPGFEAKYWPDAALDTPIILFDPVIQVFTLADFDRLQPAPRAIQQDGVSGLSITF
jgi:hypothetical protein